jgi:transcriptional regulator with XRE-family HTH domain
MNTNTATRIKQLREYCNYTQAYMALKLGISQNTYSRVESGQIIIKPDRLERIAGILGVSIADVQSEAPGVYREKIKEADIVTQLESMARLLKGELEIIKQQNNKILATLCVK